MISGCDAELEGKHYLVNFYRFFVQTAIEIGFHFEQIAYFDCL
jgi:hypothetical protein